MKTILLSAALGVIFAVAAVVLGGRFMAWLGPTLAALLRGAA